MITIFELAALIFIIYIIYKILNDRNKKEYSKTPHDILKSIYNRCDGPWDDVVISEEEYNDMKKIFGENKIKK